MTVWNPLVSIGVIALNEEDYLPRLLEDIRAQDYPLENIELVLIDSGSTDGTREIMEAFAREHTEFHDVVVYDNEKRITPAGWNIFLSRFAGEVAIRIDAHAELPSNFVSNSIEVLSEGENVCGGHRPCTVPEGASDWSRILLAAEESSFGASVAKYRSGPEEPINVNSLFHATMRREVIESVGPVSEVLLRAEDNDYYYRIRRAGYRLRLDPRIRSYQIIRTTLPSMVKQKYGNGYWMGRALFIQPKAVGIHHLVPLIFVTSLTVAGFRAARKKPGLLITIGSTYGVADIVMSVLAARSAPATPKALALPFIFPLLHVGYGIGTVRGIVDGLLKLRNR